MFALRFRFPTGRYHATPWGRHVNEGAVAWPPEPWRILRALIAVSHRKAPAVDPDQSKLSGLVDALSESLPVFLLPPAIHAHTRHYMPQGALDGGREKTALVFDAFYRLEKDAEIVAAWPELDLPGDLFDLAAALANGLGYLGRAESFVEACADKAYWDLDEADPRIARPINARGDAMLNREISDVIAPLSPADYVAALPRLRAQAESLKPAARRLAEACLPNTLLDALQIDTGVLRDAGWSRPPASRFVAYAHPKIGPTPAAWPTTAGRPARRMKPPTTARFLLAGAPAPLITETLPIAEVFRAALMAHLGRTGRPTPPVLSGRSETGVPLRGARHGHAFFLPEDADGDDRIDHLVLHAADGLDEDVLSACAALKKLWIDRGRNADQDDTTEPGRREWHVALSQVGEIGAFADCALLANSQTWESVTPYLRPWHVTQGATALEWCQAHIRREAELRGLGAISSIEFLGTNGARASGRNVLEFRRFRSRRGLVQPDRSGASLRLTFDSPVNGPMALGFGAHFGLGLFAAR